MIASDWKTEIVRMAYWKQVAAEHDKEHVLPWHLPRVGAADDKIVEAEKCARVSFSDEFKAFLRYADGWPGFHIATDLFGTDDFILGRAQRVFARRELIDFIRQMGFKDGEVIPIGASEVDLEVFLMVSPHAPRFVGNIIWFVNEEIERFAEFSAFFSSMVSYNARIAKKMGGLAVSGKV